MDIEQLIKWDSSGASGGPTFRNSGISLQTVLEQLAGGMNADEIIATFPALAKDDVRAAIAFAAKVAQRHLSIPE